jgi:hypothetical protein
MCGTRPSEGLKTWLTALAIVVVAFATTHAEDPNARPSPKEPTTAPAEKPPSSEPTPPVKRTPASFTRQMPFSEAIDILRNCSTPPLNIIVLWRQLDQNAGITPETPIGIDGVPGLRVRQYLDLLMLSLSAGASAELSYIVDGGAVTIGTANALRTPKKARRVTRVYDISDLVSEPARYSLPPVVFGVILYGGLYPGPTQGFAVAYPRAR